MNADLLPLVRSQGDSHPGLGACTALLDSSAARVGGLELGHSGPEAAGRCSFPSGKRLIEDDWNVHRYSNSHAGTDREL